MALTAVGTNVLEGERRDSVITLPITDSTTLTVADFLELSSGKLIKSITTLSTSLVGVAATTKTSGVYSTSGQQDHMGAVTEGLLKLKGLVEGSGGTYKTAIAVGTKVSMHYDATSGYGQFVVASEAAPVGTVVKGTVASSGSTDDQWDYVLVQMDFERVAGGSSVVGTGAITTAKLAALAVTDAKVAVGAISATKTATDVPAQINSTKQWMDCGSYAMTATESTAVIDWSSTLTSTAGVIIFTQALTATTPIPIPGTMTDTSFTLTGTNSQTGNWFAWIPNTSK